MKYDSQAQIAAIRKELRGKPVAEWASFDRII